MNAFQAFLASRPFGYIKDTDLPELSKLDKLCPVVVRCGFCRFTCPAQDVATLTGYVRKAGDYVRDASIAPSAIERAAEWQPGRSLAVLEAISPGDSRHGCGRTGRSTAPPERVSAGLR